MLELETYSDRYLKLNVIKAGETQFQTEYTDLQTNAVLTNAEVGDILERGANLVAWYNELKDYALSALLDGWDIPGFKVVEGRGSRDWTDLDAALQILQERGVAEAMLYERRPVTPPALEKALGKGPFAEIAGDLVTKKPGKPALAPESDRRPPYNAAQLAFGVGNG